MDIKQTIEDTKEQFSIFERPSAANSRILLAIVSDLVELLNNYERDIDELELEIRTLPFEKINHKVAILETYRSVVKNLNHILRSPFINPKPPKITNDN